MLDVIAPDVNACEVELFLAKLYTDDALLARFVANPAAELALQQLSSSSMESLLQMDLQDLQLAVASYGHKRRQLQANRHKKFTLLWFYKKFFR